ncbi:hypothetical protein SAMN05421734_10936 [Pelagirhabdus alkalitolerans]|uniref:Uncharacterized protein n=1 Tax=Pelagirhabdus alkalitolerans TaxID=1612202 RepID=A0A1G6LQJ6_9BACI|nr:hypothetical protein [Pelagirhabdus alkalitolerans]SDC45469.1 hypothetical protein SAMN05421734_10936 [Pelagirhabdus alkalitolerans]
MDQSIELNYTQEMEKAMHQNHGCGYAAYGIDMSERLKVERTREQSHKDGMALVTDINRQVHR